MFFKGIHGKLTGAGGGGFAFGLLTPMVPQKNVQLAKVSQSHGHTVQFGKFCDRNSNMIFFSPYSPIGQPNNNNSLSSQISYNIYNFKSCVCSGTPFAIIYWKKTFLFRSLIFRDWTVCMGSLDVFFDKIASTFLFHSDRSIFWNYSLNIFLLFMSFSCLFYKILFFKKILFISLQDQMEMKGYTCSEAEVGGSGFRIELIDLWPPQ